MTWINVNDKLPTEEFSLVLREEHTTKTRTISIEHLSEYTNLDFTKSMDADVFSKITHWQPLPDKKVEDD